MPSRGLPLAKGRAGKPFRGQPEDGQGRPPQRRRPPAGAPPRQRRPPVRPAPVTATSSTRSVMAASPNRAGIPNSCSSRAPDPAIIPIMQPNRNRRNTAEKKPRRTGCVPWRMILSKAVYPVRLAMSSTIQPKSQKAAMASTMPARPQAPNRPKNCSSSCPERKPAPRKLPVKSTAICIGVIFFFMDLPPKRGGGQAAALLQVVSHVGRGLAPAESVAYTRPMSVRNCISVKEISFAAA